jgi:hypothetical protein
MTSINVGSVPAEFPHKRDVIVDCGAHGPMSQQHAGDFHGHEMHPQNWCSWSAVMIQMQESMKERIVCIRSLRRDRRSANGGALPAMALRMSMRIWCFACARPWQKVPAS